MVGLSAQAACIEGGVLGGQRNPLFDDALPRAAASAVALATATSTGQLLVAGEAACAGSISNSSYSSYGLAGDSIADIRRIHTESFMTAVG